MTPLRGVALDSRPIFRIAESPCDQWRGAITKSPNTPRRSQGAASLVFCPITLPCIGCVGAGLKPAPHSDPPSGGGFETRPYASTQGQLSENRQFNLCGRRPKITDM